MSSTCRSRRSLAAALLGTLSALAVSADADDAGRPAAGSPNYLDQGWTDDERHDFYYLTQGSQLVPYHWFLALELPDRDELFRSDTHMAGLGYVTQRPEPRRNPHGLPIGFVLDDNPATVHTLFSIKKGFLGPNYEEENYPSDNAWLGLTCAACHTADISYGGKSVRIDGGTAMADHEGFLNELAAALRATHEDDDKFDRFSRRVLDTAHNAGEAEELRKRVDAYTRVLERVIERNKGDHPYGFARLDAFGAILNQVTAAALEIPENERKANAPVSFPFLWDAPHLDWVQWNASVAVPIERNVGEVLGVYAHAKLTGTPAEGQFTSTARVDHLFRLEESLAKLKAPVWPEDLFGEIDAEKAELGRKLFAANCVECHHVREANGRFPMTEPNSAGKRFIRTTVVHHAGIGTDPQMAKNFVERLVKPGDLRPHLPEMFRDKPVVPAGVLLKVAVRGVTRDRLAAESPRPLDAEQLAALNGHRDPSVAPPENGAGYKARPLNGVWATAPFLHNGSVPNLDELLKPADRRVKRFRVGSREFDPVRVGFRDEGGFEFDTSLAGNLNGGHTGPGHTQTQGSDGGQRDFTDDERAALIEYIKTLR